MGSLYYHLVAIGGVMVSVLAIDPKFHRFKPGRERWIYKGDKNPQHVFFQREVKPSASCLKVLGFVKTPCGV
jgi:hypothetical protein